MSPYSNTIIPLNNPPLKSGELDTHGLPQTMVFPNNHPEPNLAGKAKGMLAVIKEQKSVYDKLVSEAGCHESDVPISFSIHLQPVTTLALTDTDQTR
jgi:hypothetical protein